MDNSPPSRVVTTSTRPLAVIGRFVRVVFGFGCRFFAAIHRVMQVTLSIIFLLLIAAVVGLLIQLNDLDFDNFNIHMFDSRNEPGEVADPGILVIDLRNGFEDVAKGGQPTLAEASASLIPALHDDRIQAVLVIAAGVKSYAVAREFGEKLKEFRAVQKPVWAHVGSLGGNVTPEDYLLASYADRIWALELANINPHGLSVSQLFFKDFLDKYMIDVDMSQRHEYKGGTDSFRRNSMSPAVRENATQVLMDLDQAVCKLAADNRQTNEQDFCSDLVAGPLLTSEAHKTKFIDEIGSLDDSIEALLLYRFEDEASEALASRSQSGEFTESHLTSLGNAWVPEVRQEQRRDDDTEGIVHIGYVVFYGELTSNPDFPSTPFGQSDTTSWEDSLGQIRGLIEDEDIDALVVRIDSPGGEAFVAEQISQVLHHARTLGLPVVASLGDIAASGGYWIALPADRIVVEPLSITGSIGVFGGKLSFGRLLTDVGIHHDKIITAPNANMYSVLEPFSSSQQEQHERNIDQVYEVFTNKVKAARELTDAQVDHVARGRIWLGQDAAGVGLADAVGGFAEAEHEVLLLLHKTDDGNQRVRWVYPPESYGIWEFAQENIYRASRRVLLPSLGAAVRDWLTTQQGINVMLDPSVRP